MHNDFSKNYGVTKLEIDISFIFYSTDDSCLMRSSIEIRRCI